MKQLGLFESALSESTFDYAAGEAKEEKVKPEQLCLGDKIMIQLERWTQIAEQQNREIKAMLDELQADWTDDEKLQINDPKEWQRQQKLKETQPEINLSMEAIEVLKQTKIEGNIVKLPETQLDRKDYEQVKKKLELIGGKWKGGKVMGFVFQEDPTELLEQIAGGEDRNLKKEYQFFGTPDSLCDEMVQLAEIEPYDEILEPSAGQGAIVKAIHRATNQARTVWGFELMPLNQTFLNKIVGFRLLGNDFLSECDTSFDKIIANPPFTKSQDIDHIRKMYECLKPGGRIVTLSSPSWTTGTQKKQVDFRQWLDELRADIREVPAGTFKESGTNIKTMLLIIDKPNC